MGRNDTRAVAKSIILVFFILLAAAEEGWVSEVKKADESSNRLIHEKSPYLLQHAYNPVDWYPWGDEAFEKAKREDKPVFLSVGYSTCHWCHVMEEESFENPEIAKVMNEGFVSIKVDREERPDVDQIYMQAVMAMTGSGGWPMSVFLTPDMKPFYGGTYFPPEDRWGRPGFVTLLNTISGKWKAERESLLRSGEELTRLLRAQAKEKSALSHKLDEGTLQKAYEQYQSQFDGRFGGFGAAPKFPRSHSLSFLLRYWKRTGEAEALRMTEKTLLAMAEGGMYDQLGGGFHRYSTDAAWHVPHFEKMLYDQALLSKTYLEAFQAARKEEYAKIAREIFDYVLRDMTHPGGGFYSAEDADSAPDAAHPENKSEGAFYIWAESEVRGHLGDEAAGIFNHFYGIKKEGNAREDPHGEFRGKNILFAAHSPEETAQAFKQPVKEIEKILDESKAKLIEIRARRLRPHLDDKVLADWNGLMISSLAFGSRVLNEPRYGEAARKAADFVLNNLKRKDGRLLHRWREGEAAIPGFLEDYAFFIHGLVDLYEATFDPAYLEEAKFLSGEMFRLFWDEAGGGFFLTASDAEKLIARTKDLYDGAIPSGNSVAALAVLRTGRLTMRRELESLGQSTLEAFSTELSGFPSGYPQMLLALDFVLGPSREIVIAGRREDTGFGDIIRTLYGLFLPNKVVLFHPSEGQWMKKIEQLSPFVAKQLPLGGKTTAYVCKNYVCDLPVTKISKLKTLLGSSNEN